MLCIVAALMAERFRVAHRGNAATLTERWTRVLFPLTVAGAVGLCWT